MAHFRVGSALDLEADGSKHWAATPGPSCLGDLRIELAQAFL